MHCTLLELFSTFCNFQKVFITLDIEQRKIARRNREIQDKLDAINERISKTLGTYELMEGEEAEMGRGGGDMQFVRDMNELMEIATDAVKKRKVSWFKNSFVHCEAF